MDSQGKYKKYLCILVSAALVGCSEKTVTIGDMYLEAWTALEAYKHGKYKYIPSDNKILVTTKKDDSKFKVVAISAISGKKIALHLTFPDTCLISKNETCLQGANKEFDALRKCVDKAVNRQPSTSPCSSTSLIINGEMGQVVKDQLNAPHMDVWIYDVD